MLYTNIGIIVFWFAVLLMVFQERKKIRGFLGFGLFLFAYLLLQFNILGSKGVMIALVAITSLIVVVAFFLLFAYCLVRCTEGSNYWEVKDSSA